MGRIFWKPEEKKILVENIVQQLRTDRFKNFLPALQEAQSALAEDRRRSITSIAPFREIEVSVKQMLAEPETTHQEVPTTASPAVVQQVINKEDLKTVVEELFFQLVDPIVDTLMAEVENKITASMKDVIGPAISAFLSSFKNIQNGTKTAAVPVKKLSVAVVGLKGDQFTYLEREFGDRFNLTCYDSSDGAGERLQSLVASKDCVFVNTKFVSHSKIACTEFATGKLVKYYGGMSNVKGLLEQYWRKTSQKP